MVSCSMLYNKDFKSTLFVLKLRGYASDYVVSYECTPERFGSWSMINNFKTCDCVRYEHGDRMLLMIKMQ